MSNSSDSVEFRLILRDEFSKAFTAYQGQAKASKTVTNDLENATHSLRNAVIGMISAYVGFSVLKDSYELFQNQSNQLVKLSQVYNDNSKYTLENIDSLKKLAIEQEKVTGVFREDTEQMEVALLKHHDIKVAYKDIIPVISDFAAATGKDSVDASNQLSRVLGNPMRAMQLLRQAGVDITKAQGKWMQSMYESGKYAEYQGFVLKALEGRYHGVAAAMLANDPGRQLELQFRQAQFAMGELEKEMLIDLMPTIQHLIGYIKEMAEWLKNHKAIVEDVGKVVLWAAAAYTAWTIATKIWAGWMVISNAYMVAKNAIMVIYKAYQIAVIEGDTIWQAAQYALGLATETATAALVEEGIAMSAILGPLGIIAGLAIAAGIAYETMGDDAATAANKVDNLRNAMNKMQQDTMLSSLNKEQTTVEEARFKKKYGLTLQEANQQGLLTSNGPLTPEQAAGKAPIFSVDANKYSQYQNKQIASGMTDSASGATESAGTSSVTGQKSVTINVSINKLVETIKIMSQTVKEGADISGEHVVKALLSATNQFSASADI